MKKLLFIIIAVTVCLTMSGQQIYQPNNRYRSYDVLEPGTQEGQALVCHINKRNNVRYYR